MAKSACLLPVIKVSPEFRARLQAQVQRRRDAGETAVSLSGVVRQLLTEGLNRLDTEAAWAAIESDGPMRPATRG